MMERYTVTFATKVDGKPPSAWSWSLALGFPVAEHAFSFADMLATGNVAARVTDNESSLIIKIFNQSQSKLRVT